MDFDAFLKEALPPMGYAWQYHRRRAVKRKIHRRMDELRINSLDAYLNLLKTSDEERKHFKTLLPVTVSRFFRNKRCYELLQNTLFPAILKQLAAKEAYEKELRIWSAGGASGEEPYSIAIVWDRWFSASYPNIRLNIRATDIDEAALARAREGIYSASSLNELPSELIGRYFKKEGSLFKIDPSITERVHWSRHDIRVEPALGNNHIIFCCYLAFTYFTKEIQGEVAIKLAEALEGGGYLVLGKKENLPSSAFDLFERASNDVNVFQKRSYSSA